MFGFGKKKKPESPLLRRKVAPPSAGQKRTAFRMPVEFPVFYTLVGRRGRRRATANDLSAGGLRLISDEDFLKGSIMSLEFTVPDDFLENMTIDKEVYEETPFGKRAKSTKVRPPGFAPFRMDAKSLITFFDLKARRFAYGMTFVDADPIVTEELQRFIHLWQLNQLRLRNLD